MIITCLLYHFIVGLLILLYIAFFRQEVVIGCAEYIYLDHKSEGKELTDKQVIHATVITFFIVFVIFWPFILPSLLS